MKRITIPMVLLAVPMLVFFTPLTHAQSVVLVVTNDLAHSIDSAIAGSLRQHGFVASAADAGAAGHLWINPNDVGGLWVFSVQRDQRQMYFQLVDAISGSDTASWSVESRALSALSVADFTSNACGRIAVGPITRDRTVGISIQDAGVSVVRLRSLLVRQASLTSIASVNSRKAALSLQDLCVAGSIPLSVPSVGRMQPAKYVLVVTPPYSCRLIESETGKTVDSKVFALDKEEAVLKWIVEHARGHVR